MPASHCDRIAPVATLGTNIVSEDGKAVWNLAAPLLLGLAIAASFGLLAWAPITHDDVLYAANSPLTTGPWPGWAAFFMRPAFPLGYEPLNFILHRWLHAWGGEQPLAYRLSSMLLHWANAVLAWSLFRRALREERLAFIGALLFAVYPAHVEVIAISASKKHLIVALLCLASLRIQRPGLGRAWICALSWLLLAAGLLTKESAIVIPFSVLVWEYAEGGGRRKRWPLWTGYAVICLAFGLWHMQLSDFPTQPPEIGSWSLHWLDCAGGFAELISRLAWPWGLCLEHSGLFAGGPSAPSWLWPAGAWCAAAISLGWLLRRLYRRDRVAWAAAAWTVICLAPFLNIAPVLLVRAPADRYLYLAHAGFCLLFMRGLASAAGRLRPATARWLKLAPAGLAAIYCAMSVRRAALFTDPVALWTQTAACAPGVPRARLMLAQTCLERGRLPEAWSALSAARGLAPEHPMLHQYLAWYYHEAGRPEAAVAEARERLRLWPDEKARQDLDFYLDAARIRRSAAPR